MKESVKYFMLTTLFVVLNLEAVVNVCEWWSLMPLSIKAFLLLIVIVVALITFYFLSQAMYYKKKEEEENNRKNFYNRD